MRRLAEAKLLENKKKTGPLPELESEARRLIHELQVHQIELEMQNEELMQTRVELEAALDQYTHLYDFAPVGYFALARDGQIQKANLAGVKLLGAERSKVISRRFRQFVAIDSRLTFSAFLDKVFTMEGNNKAACEVLLQGEGTTSHWVHIEIATDDPQSEVCCVALVNITRRKETEMALRESEDKFKYVFEYSTIEKSLTLPSGEVRPNQALCNMLGYTQAKLQSKKWQDITHPDDIELTKEKSINSSPIHRVQQGLQKVYP